MQRRVYGGRVQVTWVQGCRLEGTGVAGGDREVNGEGAEERCREGVGRRGGEWCRGGARGIYRGVGVHVGEGY